VYFLALATDYDGTLAQNGRVDDLTVAAIRRFKGSGRYLILVSGRELPDIKRLFPEYALFDRIVAENGALLYDPSKDQERELATPVPAAVATRLRELNATPLSCGRVIMSTWEPHQGTALEVIHELRLELQIAFNKGAVMIMPPGVNKATGLSAALYDLDLSPQNTVAIGDAENDHAFLSTCGLSAAVANALPQLKSEADLLMTHDHGRGVAELIDVVLQEDANVASRLEHGIDLGRDQAGNHIHIEPYEGNVLIIGPSACGKSTLATALAEGMVRKHFEFCVIDPEGDYVDLRDAVCIGSRDLPPSTTEAMQFLDQVRVNLVVNMQALDLPQRWKLFARLLTQTSLLRARTGRPHWLVIDDAHEVLSGSHETALATIPPSASIFITAYPQVLAVSAIKSIDTIVALGNHPDRVLFELSKSFDLPITEAHTQLQPGQGLCWRRRGGPAPVAITLARPSQGHKRHAGKYAVGDVGPERSFYFNNPANGTKLRAQNLYRFMEIASAIDDATWERHLRAGDYSAWFHHVIKDDALSSETARIEQNQHLTAAISRNVIRKAIWDRYAAPCLA
jgi:hydroxymethylpyrimidine pyrophosphatase-like HAD family hydrolase/energy-coupling factor transporter ATP-binding protein EcfA2